MLQGVDVLCSDERGSLGGRTSRLTALVFRACTRVMAPAHASSHASSSAAASLAGSTLIALSNPACPFPTRRWPRRRPSQVSLGLVPIRITHARDSAADTSSRGGLWGAAHHHQGRPRQDTQLEHGRDHRPGIRSSQLIIMLTLCDSAVMPVSRRSQRSTPTPACRRTCLISTG